MCLPCYCLTFYALLLLKIFEISYLHFSFSCLFLLYKRTVVHFFISHYALPLLLFKCISKFLFLFLLHLDLLDIKNSVIIPLSYFFSVSISLLLLVFLSGKCFIKEIIILCLFIFIFW